MALAMYPNGFNSKMVRLKEKIDKTNGRKPTVFQFQNGSIKSPFSGAIASKS